MLFDKKIFKDLVSEICDMYNTESRIVEMYLSLSIAKAYGGIHGAVIGVNGNVTVAFKGEGDYFEVKDFIISRKIFKTTLRNVQIMLREDLFKKDITSFTKNKIVEVVDVLIVDKKKLCVISDEEKGYLRDIKINLNKDQLFFNDYKNIKNKNIGDSFVVMINDYNIDNKKINCVRFCREIALESLVKEFNQLNEMFETHYTISKKIVKLNRDKSVKYFVEFGNKPSGLFMSKLSKILNKKLGKVTLNTIKIKG